MSIWSWENSLPTSWCTDVQGFIAINCRKRIKVTLWGSDLFNLKKLQNGQWFFIPSFSYNLKRHSLILNSINMRLLRIIGRKVFKCWVWSSFDHLTIHCVTWILIITYFLLMASDDYWKFFSYLCDSINHFNDASQI